ncbi:hypothetical protein VPH35_127318 [Triticum aestivum]
MNLASIPWGSVIRGILGLVLLWQATRLLHWLWWCLRRLGRALHAQGLRGTPYRFLTGDIIKANRRNRGARSKPMLLGCHDISPHVASFLHDVLRKHGKMCVSWLGPTPKVTIVDPSLGKEVMSNKFGHFEKLRFPALSMLLAKGVADYEGEKWAKHRRILNPAFHLEKLKIESILRNLIEKRMKAMQEGESTKDDLLGLILHSSMTATNENSQSIPGMTIEEVIEECKLFYFAGSETTSVLLTWTMIVLSMHPEWQYRARNEILGIFGKNKPEYEGFGRLKTVTMILYEVLRLYPPAITFIRKTCKDMKIGGITYPAAILIELPCFNPERFAEGISKASKDVGAFLPFGWGPRVCIGQQFALLAAKMAMCMILQHFEFSLAQAYTHAPHDVTFLRPMHGAQIKLYAI